MNTYSRYNSLIYSIGALSLGILLVLTTDPDQILNFAIKFLGVLAITIGAIIILVQLMQNNRKIRKEIPFFGIFTTIFGILLLVRPDVWVSLFVVLLGLIMILMSLNQMLNYRAASRIGFKISPLYYIFPILLAAAGALTILEPAFIKESIVLFVGIWMILYGIVEFIGFLTLRK